MSNRPSLNLYDLHTGGGLTAAAKMEEARKYLRCIRAELDELDDVMNHAASFRSYAFIQSLNSVLTSAETANKEALRWADRKVSAS